MQAERMNKPKRDLAVVHEGEVIPAMPTPRVARLATVKECSKELARLYKAARRGTVDPAIAARLAYVMGVLINSLKVGDLEARLDRLEEAAQLKRLPPPDEAQEAEAIAAAEAEAAIGDKTIQ
jgi:hypothetical protein